MAETTVSTALRVKQWDDKAHREYIRSNRFKRYMGTNENSIIQLKEDLTKKKGDAITINLLGALDSSTGYNDGSTDLVGNEKALPNDGHQVSIGVVRDATLVNVEEEQASPISIRNAGKTALRDLQMRYMRNDLITALGSMGGIAYGSATEAQKDAFLAANTDRFLFGAAKGNTVATHAGSLANIDGTNDRLTKEVVSLLKRTAQSASTENGEGIRPFRYGEDEETFVLFAGTNAFRDLKNDMQGVHKDAMQEGKNNPLFSGTTSLIWDGVVIREIPELPVYADVGADPDGTGALPPIDVEPVYLCGSQALAVAWGMRTKTTVRKEDDYGFKYGVGFMEMRGIDKVLWGQGTAGKQWGMVTGYVASIADA